MTEAEKPSRAGWWGLKGPVLAAMVPTHTSVYTDVAQLFATSLCLCNMTCSLAGVVRSFNIEQPSENHKIPKSHNPKHFRARALPEGVGGAETSGETPWGLGGRR